jgi:hypothetical protein
MLFKITYRLMNWRGPLSLDNIVNMVFITIDVVVTSTCERVK